jgi:hypothetical protein
MQQPPRPGPGQGPYNAPQSPPPRPLVPPRHYGSLRMLASACVISAWLSLVLSVLFGLGMLVAPSPSAIPGVPPSYSGGGGDLGLSPGGGASQLGPLLALLGPGLKMLGVVTTIGGGILSFFFLAALGQGLYLLLDMEENTRITAQALSQIARRQGS